MARIDVVPVIMAGGSGTRLWPLSRAGFPKQFLVPSGNRSLFLQAVRRLDGLGAEDMSLAMPLVVGNEENRFLILEQLREMAAGNVDAASRVLLEPVGRNTAPAVTLAALLAVSTGDDPVLLVLSADQSIADEEAFVRTLQDSVRCAARGAIVILGTPPDRPETGFGYIRSDGESSPQGDYGVAEFVEKPDLETARRYLASGAYTWNAGMFVLKASVWLSALKEFRPDILQATELAFAERTTERSFVRPDEKAFATIPAESVDYAVIERCSGSKFPSACCFWMPVGAISAPGTRFGRRARAMPAATSSPVMLC